MASSIRQSSSHNVSTGSLESKHPISEPSIASTEDPEAGPSGDTPQRPGTNSSTRANPPSVPSRRSFHSRSRRTGSPRHQQNFALNEILNSLGDDFELVVDGETGSLPLNDGMDQAPERRSHGRPFIVRRKTMHQRAHDAAQNNIPNTDRFDYERRYPPDDVGKEMEPTARVWRVYLDESQQFDLDMVENMRETVDVILVFAGLFSAIVATLVALSATALQLDHPKVTNMLLAELIAIQRANAVGESIASIPPSAFNAESPNGSTSDTTDYWVNGLWFTSLAFSLSTALVSVLVRQWIQAYSAPTFEGSPQAQAEVRHFRYHGIETWHVPLIIGLLPTLLHLSLFLFLAGLIVFLFTLSSTIASVVATITFITYAAYVISNVLPASYPQCPYKTPLSRYIFPIVLSIKVGYSWLWSGVYRWEPWLPNSLEHLGSSADVVRLAFRAAILGLYLLPGVCVRLPWYLLHREDTLPSFFHFLCKPLWALHYRLESSDRRLHKDMETWAIEYQKGALHVQMFSWLIQTSPNLSARLVVIPRFNGGLEDAIALFPSASYNERQELVFHSISAQVTGQRFRGIHSFALDHPERFTDIEPAIIDALLAGQEYLRIAHSPWIAPVTVISEEAYKSSSRIDWDLHPAECWTLEWASRCVVLGLCIHFLYEATADPTEPFTLSLLAEDLQPVYPAMRIVTSGTWITATTDAVRKLSQWLPTLNFITFVDEPTIDTRTLQALLEVATFLFGLGEPEFQNIFEERQCLAFWKLIYEHPRKLVTQELADAFGRMMTAHVTRFFDERDRRWGRLGSVFDHLQVICLWELKRCSQDLSPHIVRMIEIDPRDKAWVDVHHFFSALPSTVEGVDRRAVDVLLKNLTSHLGWSNSHLSEVMEPPINPEA